MLLRFKSCINDEEIPKVIFLEINEGITLSLEDYLEKYRSLLIEHDLESVNIRLANNYFDIKTDLSNYKIDFLELKIMTNNLFLVLSHKYTNELFEYYLCKNVVANGL